MALVLRKYQIDAVNRVRAAFAAGLSRVILMSPTGSGKTEMAIEILNGAIRKGTGTAFLANKIQLIQQASERLSRSGVDHGILQGENTRDLDKQVIIASIDTVRKRGLPSHIKLLIIDECHACAGNKAYRSIMRGRKVIGLTATPYSRGLGRTYWDSGKLFEDMVVAANIKDLMADGYLVEADIYAPSDPDLTGVKIVAGDYEEDSLATACDKPELVGDIVSHWLKYSYKKPTVVFCVNIQHSKHIAQEFNNNGIMAVHIDCYTPQKEKKQILHDLETGKYDVVCNANLLCEGWDFPACRTLILAKPTKSINRMIQMSGRVLRPAPGKDRALILDHSGTICRLGMPWDDFGTDLDERKPKESKKSAAKKKEDALRICKKCSYVMKASNAVCPMCGDVFQRTSKIKTQDGDLIQISGKTTKKQKITERGRQQIYSELLGYARDHGYQHGWASHKYYGLFGDWPNGLEKTPLECSGEIQSWVRHEQIRYSHRRR